MNAKAVVDRTVYGLLVPLCLAASHDIAHPGFQSARKGEFIAEGDPPEGPADIVLRDITILGVPLAKLVLGKPNNRERPLQVHFDRAMTTADAFKFLQQFADAWSAVLAKDQRDPWYGNLYVDIQWAGVRTLTAQSGGIESSLELTSIQGIAVSAAHLEALRWSPLTDVFVEGMKASQPKSKFLFWFVVLEELEKREEFLPFFTPMFSAKEKEQLQAAVKHKGPALQRLNGLLNNPNATLEGRSAKLARILEAIEAASVEGLHGAISVDQTMCGKLIDQRNKVAHKGSSIDKNLLYTVLFPLSQAALNYILDKEVEAAVPS